jgi:hypothetical protein
MFEVMANPQATCRLRIFLFLEALLKPTMKAAVFARALRANRVQKKIVEVNHER